MMQLFPPQETLKNNVYSAWSHARNVIMVLPTGGGKTVVFSSIISDFDAPSIVVAHRAELVSQTSLALVRNGIPHRIIGQPAAVKWCMRQSITETGSNFINQRARCLVASVDTLVRMGHDPIFGQIRLWVCDEAHHLQLGNKWGRAIKMFPHAFGLGPTATPERADGRALGAPDGVFDDIVVGPSMRDLINGGYLTDFKVFAPTSIDRSQLHLTQSGDFSPAENRKVIHSSQIVGDVVMNYLRFAPGKLGVTFCVDVESATEMARAFRQAGVPAETVTGQTPPDLRSNLMRRFGRGEFNQLCVVDVVSEGTDIPAIDVVSLARPSASYTTVVQQIGRALRKKEGKEIALVIDHVGNVQQFGRVGCDPLTGKSTIELDRTSWTLDGYEKKSRGKSPDAVPLRTCPECLGSYPAIEGRTCPLCGHYNEPPARTGPEMVDGDLSELLPEVLAQMQLQISRIDGPPRIPLDVPPNVENAIARRHRERQEAQNSLRQAIAQWGGFRAVEGSDVARAQRQFYHAFGVDVGTAQTLGSKEARELERRVKDNYGGSLS